jgi:hypothetical protein
MTFGMRSQVTVSWSLIYVSIRARIWPLIKFDKKAVIPGAFWRKAQGENDALGIWASAYKKGAVNRIR